MEFLRPNLIKEASREGKETLQLLKGFPLKSTNVPLRGTHTSQGKELLRLGPLVKTPTE